MTLLAQWHARAVFSRLLPHASTAKRHQTRLSPPLNLPPPPQVRARRAATIDAVRKESIQKRKRLEVQRDALALFKSSIESSCDHVITTLDHGSLPQVRAGEAVVCAGVASNWLGGE